MLAPLRSRPVQLVLAVLLVAGFLIGLGLTEVDVLEVLLVLFAAVAGVVWFRVAGARRTSLAQAEAALDAAAGDPRVAGAVWRGRATLLRAPYGARPGGTRIPDQGLLSVARDCLVFVPGPEAERRGCPEKCWRAEEIADLRIRVRVLRGGDELRLQDRAGDRWAFLLEDVPDLPSALDASGLPVRR